MERNLYKFREGEPKFPFHGPERDPRLLSTPVLCSVYNVLSSECIRCSYPDSAGNVRVVSAIGQIATILCARVQDCFEAEFSSSEVTSDEV